MPRTTTAQIRYSLRDALNQVPHGKVREVKMELKKVLGLSPSSQVWYYISGKSQPNLPQAKAVEDYFLKNWGITEVWKEISPK